MATRGCWSIFEIIVQDMKRTRTKIGLQGRFDKQLKFVNFLDGYFITCDDSNGSELAGLTNNQALTAFELSVVGEFSHQSKWITKDLIAACALSVRRNCMGMISSPS